MPLGDEEADRESTRWHLLRMPPVVLSPSDNCQWQKIHAEKVSFSSLFCGLCDDLFPDAKMLEDVGQYLIGRHFAHDVAKMEQAFTQVLRDKVTRELGR